MISTSRRLDTTLLSNICRLRPIDSEPTLQKSEAYSYLRIDRSRWLSLLPFPWVEFCVFSLPPPHTPPRAQLALHTLYPTCSATLHTLFVLRVCVFLHSTHKKGRPTQRALRCILWITYKYIYRPYSTNEYPSSHPTLLFETS
jgi:hypothetical protein